MWIGGKKVLLFLLLFLLVLQLAYSQDVVLTQEEFQILMLNCEQREILIQRQEKQLNDRITKYASLEIQIQNLKDSDKRDSLTITRLEKRLNDERILIESQLKSIKVLKDQNESIRRQLTASGNAIIAAEQYSKGLEREFGKKIVSSCIATGAISLLVGGIAVYFIMR